VDAWAKKTEETQSSREKACLVEVHTCSRRVFCESKYLIGPGVRILKTHNAFLPCYLIFWGECTTKSFQIVTIIFVMSVHPSLYKNVNAQEVLNEFNEIWQFREFSYNLTRYQLWLQSGNNNGHLTRRRGRISSVIRAQFDNIYPSEERFKQTLHAN
jgi:hypothetical protein